MNWFMEMAPSKQTNKQTEPNKQTDIKKAFNHLAHIHKLIHGGGAERLRHGGTPSLNSEIFGLQFYCSSVRIYKDKQTTLHMITDKGMEVICNLKYKEVMQFIQEKGNPHKL